MAEKDRQIYMEFSKAELAFIRSFHITNIEKLLDAWVDNPVHVYKHLMQVCFTGDRRGENVDCLRVLIKACNECRVYRRTPE